MSDHHAEGEHGHGAHDKRHFLKHAVEHYCHMLSEQGPMNITFVHNNTLFGLQQQNLHFEASIAESQRVSGAKGFLDNDEYRAYYRRDRIVDEDIAVAMRRRNDIKDKLDEVIATVGSRPIKLEEVYAANMVYGVEPIDSALLRYEVFQNNALGVFRADVPEAVRKASLAKAEKDLAAGLAQIGRDLTFADWMGAHIAMDVTKHLRQQAVAQLIANADVEASQPAEKSMQAMGIPQERQAGYLAVVDSQFSG